MMGDSQNKGSSSLPAKPMFPVGDFVLARMRGHEAWPAKVKAIEIVGTGLDQRYAYYVKFYGTYDFATCEEKDLFLFNKDTLQRNEQYRRKDPRKRDQYDRAVREVKEDIEFLERAAKKQKQCK